jgi:2-oxoglutarate dehydrogenase E2 component (dihydrolipoamide succinyltransferase)
MTIQIRVPELGESVVEATVGEWRVAEGTAVNVGDVLVDLETDKVDVEVGADAAGVLVNIVAPAGADVAVGDVLAEIDPNGAAPAESAKSTPEPEPTPETAVAPPETDAATPVARRMASAQGVDLAQVSGSGPRGRVTKQDVAAHLQGAARPSPAPEAAPQRPSTPPAPPSPAEDKRETRVRMSRRRRTIAGRLVEAQHTAALLTTFNEVDMGAVIALRKRRQEAFVARHGVKLGFSSFFVKAAIGALKAFPRLNAEIQGDEMVLKQYYDIGMAVGAEEGLVVPVVRNADRKSFAEIEHEVKALAGKARDGSLSLEDLRGGTFTITNGGVFGSMLSTPILNPPQVGILGLHNIVERPVALNGAVVIRPIMYLALTYDHRIVDGREAVLFLVRVKELIEDPEALLLEG